MNEVETFLISLIGGSFGSFLGAWFTYLFSMRKMIQEYKLSNEKVFEQRKTEEKIKAYNKLMNIIDTIIEGGIEDTQELSHRVNEINNVLLLFASDEMNRKWSQATDEAERTKRGKPLAEFKVYMRKEIFPETTISPKDVWTIKFRAPK